MFLTGVYHFVKHTNGCLVGCGGGNAVVEINTHCTSAAILAAEFRSSSLIAPEGRSLLSCQFDFLSFVHSWTLQSSSLHSR